MAEPRKRRGGPSGRSPSLAERERRGMPRPVTVSFAPADLARLDALVAAHGLDSRSALLRFLVKCDWDAMQRRGASPAPGGAE